MLEAVPAEQRPDGRWVVLGTPALADGFAAGDVLAVAEDGAFAVDERGGNLGITVMEDRPFKADALSALDEVARRLGGRVEGGSDTAVAHLRVLTIPVTAGFAAVESSLNAWTGAFGGSWAYTNVYADDEGTKTLDWWN